VFIGLYRLCRVVVGTVTVSVMSGCCGHCNGQGYGNSYDVPGTVSIILTGPNIDGLQNVSDVDNENCPKQSSICNRLTAFRQPYYILGCY
jgi:hypothetical protein